MNIVYDLEVFPNFFSICYVDVDTTEYKTLYIFEEHNDFSEIIGLFNDKDWFIGYNSTYFDDRLIEHMIQDRKEYENKPANLITFNIFMTAQSYINDETNEYKYNVSFNRFDLMKIGNIQKSLKLVAVDLRHPLIQDLPYHYEHKVKEDEVEEILKYNKNDVEITKALYHDLIKEIRLRKDLSLKYGLNLMNESDSGIANRILEKDYKEATGLWYSDFKSEQTEHNSINLGECIADNVEFETDHLLSLKEQIENTVTNQESKIEFNIIVNKTRYDILKGGIHSHMPPKIYASTDDVKIIDADVSSYYPRIMLNNDIKPAHLQDIFLEMLDGYTSTRLIAKKEGDKVAADGLKIVINSIYGKLGSKYHWLKDVFAMYQVTLTGQLSLLMLIEQLEMNDIEVFYANTDGITAFVPIHKENLYKDICSKWQENNNFELEYEEYEKLIIRDVNNYIWIPKEGDPKYKGFFDIDRHSDLNKSFDKPIVPLAVYKYFTENIPVEETIESHQDIHDFCMAQKAGSKFDIKFKHIEMGRLVTDTLQHTNRYYVGKKGGHIYKESKDTGKKLGIIAGQPVYILNNIDPSMKIEDYNVKHDYYIKEANKIVGLFKYEQQSLF